MTADTRPAESMMTSATLSVWAFVVPAMTSFVTAPVLANGLGPRAFAIYALALAYAGTASALGLGRAVMREVSRPAPGGAMPGPGATVTAGLWLGAALGALLAIALAAVADALVRSAGTGADTDVVVLRLAAVGAIPATLAGVALAVPQGLGHWRTFAGVSVTGAVTSSAAGAMVAASGAGPVAVLATTTGISTLLAVTAVVVARRLAAPAPWRPDIRTMRRLAALGGDILGAQVVIALWVLAERVLVSRTLGPAALASYVVALMLGAYLQALVVAAAQVLTPTIHRASHAEPARVQELYRGTTIGVALISGAGGATIAGAGPAFLTLWMGPTLAQAAAPALPALGAAFALNGLTTAAWFLGEGLGQQRRNLVAVGIGAIIALGLLPWMAERDDLRGVALARLAALGLAPAYIWWMERSTTPIVRAPWRTLLLVMLPASLALAAGLRWMLDDVPPSWPRLVATCAAGWSLFVVVLWRTGAIPAAALARIRARLGGGDAVGTR